MISLQCSQFAFIFQPQHYASSSSMKIEPVAEDDDDDLSKDLEDALEESYRSVLEESTNNTPSKMVNHGGVISVSYEHDEKSVSTLKNEVL